LDSLTKFMKDFGRRGMKKTNQRIFLNFQNLEAEF